MERYLDMGDHPRYLQAKNYHEESLTRTEFHENLRGMRSETTLEEQNAPIINPFVPNQHFCGFYSV